MERREKMAGGIDLKSNSVAEIGALNNPILTKEEADVRYIDYANAETLRKHYEGNPHINPDQIVETDAIWGEKTLIEALGKPVDFILASHVIEHVPDLIAWLNELRSALTEHGRVKLAIPDKRFTFDFLRRETELSDVLAAYITAPRVPQPRQILDYYLNATEVDCQAAWRGEVGENTLQRLDCFEQAMNMARGALQDNAYHDAHCWVFTPRSFSILLGQLSKRGFVGFMCESFHDSERDSIEFFVSLRASNDIEEMTGSWSRMAESVSIQTPPSSGPAEQEVLQQALESLERARGEIDLLRGSTSWRVTRPLRALSSSLRRLKGG